MSNVHQIYPEAAPSKDYLLLETRREIYALLPNAIIDRHDPLDQHASDILAALGSRNVEESDEYKSLLRDFEEKDRELDERDDDVERLEANLREARKSIESMSRTEDRLRAEVADLRDQLKRKVAVIAEHEESAAGLRQRIEELKGKKS